MRINGVPVSQDARKIDSATTDGLSGTSNSLAYRVHEIEKHLHGKEYWFGDGGSNDLAENLTEIQATAGTSEAYGTALQIHDGSDLGYGAKLDAHRILVTAVSATSKVYKLAIYSGASAGGLTFLTAVVGYFPAATGKSNPIELMMPRVNYTEKLWVKLACETNSATMDFLIGTHFYTA